MSASPRSLPLVALALAVAVIVLQIQVIAGGQTWDDVRYHSEIAPPRMAAAAAVQRGELPAWWDGSGLGVPLAGDPGHGALYPAIWLAATPRALDLVLVAHLAWAALGAAVWARRRASDRAALVAGVLVATAGVIASAALRGALPALAHLPWLAAAADALVHAGTRRARSLLAAAIAALVALVALAGELAGIADAIAIALALGLSRRTARWLAAALAAGLAIGAVQWIPAMLVLPGAAGAEVGGLPLARLVELLVPGAFGGGTADRAIPAIAGDAPWAPSLFVGAPLLALAAVRERSRRVLGLVGGLTGAALIAGRGGWPAWLGAPELHAGALVLVLTGDAAGGFDALALGRRRAVLALGFAAGLAALTMAALWLLGAQHRELAPAVDRALIDGGLGALCAAGAAALAWRAPGRRIALLSLLVVAPGVGAAHAVAPVADRAIVGEPPVWAQLVAHRPPPIRVFRPVYLLDRPALEDAIATLAGGAGWRWGIAAARGEDPARPAVHDRVWLAAAHEGGALLDRFGVALAILPASVAFGRRLHALGQRGSWTLAELPVAPVASVMYGWRWAVDPGDALALLYPDAGGAGVARGVTVLAGAGAEGPSASEPAPCEITAWRAGEIALGCTADRAGYAVVSSAAAPGWTAAVDGAPAGWLAADVLRRAVAIPAGQHDVRWRYAPPGLAAGALVALAGVLALAAIAALGRRGAPS